MKSVVDPRGRADVLLTRLAVEGLERLNPGSPRINKALGDVAAEYISRVVPPVQMGPVDLLDNLGLLPKRKGGPRRVR